MVVDMFRSFHPLHSSLYKLLTLALRGSLWCVYGKTLNELYLVNDDEMLTFQIINNVEYNATCTNRDEVTYVADSHVVAIYSYVGSTA